MIAWILLLALPYLAKNIPGASSTAGDVMGFSLKPKINWKKAMKLAKQYGPAIAALTPAGPAVAAGLQLANAARAGDPAALAKVAAVQAAAQTGDPRAVEALSALKVAKAVREHVQTNA